MIHVNNFSNGALNPVLAYLMSCVGCFLTAAEIFEEGELMRRIGQSQAGRHEPQVWQPRRPGQVQPGGTSRAACSARSGPRFSPSRASPPGRPHMRT